MKIKATLVSPPGMNFDLVMYVPAEDVTNACKTSEAELSAKSTGDDVVRGAWSDGFGDDSRTVVFEVRHISGDCSADPNARWSLSIEGDKE